MKEKKNTFISRTWHAMALAVCLFLPGCGDEQATHSVSKQVKEEFQIPPSPCPLSDLGNKAFAMLKRKTQLAMTQPFYQAWQEFEKAKYDLNNTREAEAYRKALTFYAAGLSSFAKDYMDDSLSSMERTNAYKDQQARYCRAVERFYISSVDADMIMYSKSSEEFNMRLRNNDLRRFALVDAIANGSGSAPLYRAYVDAYIKVKAALKQALQDPQQRKLLPSSIDDLLPLDQYNSVCSFTCCPSDRIPVRLSFINGQQASGIEDLLCQPLDELDWDLRMGLLEPLSLPQLSPSAPERSSKDVSHKPRRKAARREERRRGKTSTFQGAEARFAGARYALLCYRR